MLNLLWLRLVEVLTVPTTFVNETRYSFRLNVTVAELQDSYLYGQRQRPVPIYRPAEGPFLSPFIFQSR